MTAFDPGEGLRHRGLVQRITRNFCQVGMIDRNAGG
jgi:hypothetical protein